MLVMGAAICRQLDNRRCVLWTAADDVVMENIDETERSTGEHRYDKGHGLLS